MSRKTAIDQFCKMCIYDPHSQGNWRQQVAECTALACPLYIYRPVDSGSKKPVKISEKRVAQLAKARQAIRLPD